MAAGDITAKRTNYSDFPCNVFDGIDDYIDIPHAAPQLGTNLTSGLTVSAWINAESLGEATGGHILNKTDDAISTGGYLFRIDSNRKICFVINAGSTVRSLDSTITYGIWVHVLATITPSGICNFYKNGSLSGVANQAIGQTTSTITSLNPLRIGNRTNATDYSFHGSIAKVKVWNYVLTTDEITEEYNGKHHNSGCIHFFKLGGDLKDYGSVGIDATNSGSIANNTMANKIQTNTNQLNLAAVTDKIIAIPVSGRNEGFVIVGANRAAA